MIGKESRFFMKINFNQNLKKLDGTDLENITLKSVTTEVLQLAFQDEQGLSGEEKAKRWVLATRVYANPGNIDLTIEEVSLIKKLIGKAYGPLIVGQAWEMLEGKMGE